MSVLTVDYINNVCNMKHVQCWPAFPKCQQHVLVVDKLSVNKIMKQLF